MPDFNNVIKINFELTLFLAYCLFIGAALNARLSLWKEIIGPQNNAYLKIFFSIASGLCVTLAFLFLLGEIGILNIYAVVICAVLTLALSFVSIFDQPGFSLFGDLFARAEKNIAPTLIETLSILILFIVVTGASIRAMGYWDDTMYHLPLARYYVEHQAIGLKEYLRFPLFPQNMDLLFALGLMLDGDLLAQGLATVPVFIAAIGLLGVSRWLLSSALPGYLSIGLFLSLPLVWIHLGFAYIENGLALFCWAATVAVAIWESSNRKSWKWLALAGALAGCAAGTKYFGGAFASILWLYILISRKSWKESMIFALAVFAFGSWWYIRSALISGDPIHPVGARIFGYFLWNEGDYAYQQQEQSRFGVPKNILNLWAALQAVKVEVFALAFLFIAFLKRADKAFKLFYAVFVVYIVFWFFATQVERYLAPITFVGCFLSVAFVVRLAKRSGQSFSSLFRHSYCVRTALFYSVRSTIGTGTCLILLAAAAIYQHAVLLPKTFATWETVLLNRPGYPLFRQANALIPSKGDRLVQIGFENGIYFYNGTVIGDWYGPGRYSSLMICSPRFVRNANTCALIPAAEMADTMKTFNSRLLAVNGSFVSIDIDDYKKRFDIVKAYHRNYLLALRPTD